MSIIQSTFASILTTFSDPFSLFIILCCLVLILLFYTLSFTILDFRAIMHAIQHREAEKE